MSIRETLCDIIGYISEQKCDGHDIDVDICECLNGIDSYYVIRLSIRVSNNLIFEEKYDIRYYDLRSLDSIRQKVDDILLDFRDKFEKNILKED